MSALADIVRGEGNYFERAQRVADALRGQPDSGAAEAVAFFEQARDDDEARFAADHLGVLPDAREQKSRLVAHALERRELLGAATLPLRGADEATVRRAVEAYLEDPDGPGTHAAAFEAAIYFPQLVRPYRDRLDDEELRVASLPGADDALTDALAKSYRDDPDPDTVAALATIRTDRAREALIDLRELVPEHEQELLDVQLESAGVVPETREASVYFHTSRGFPAPRGDSPHDTGAGWGRAVPSCPVCETPATRIVTLRASALEFELGRDPSFFWYSCSCDVLPYAYVRLAGDEPEGLMVELTDREPEHPLVPAGSLVLEEHPNQFGRGASPVTGYAAHQVGGFVPWIRPDRNPACAVCSRRTRFLAAIDSGPSLLGPLRLDGMLLCFWCDACAVSCTTKQTDVY